MPDPETIEQRLRFCHVHGLFHATRCGQAVTYGQAADLIASLRAERDVLREALEPSGDTKAAYMGEFSFYQTFTDEDGEEQSRKVYVPWTTIKEIMAAIRARAALAAGEGGR